MFDRNKVTTNLLGLVGYELPANPEFQKYVNSTNQTSRSGRNFTDNPLIKIEMLKDNADYKDISATQFNTLLQNKAKTATTVVMDKVFNKAEYIDRQLLYKFANNKVNTEPLPAGFVGYRIEPDPVKDLAFEITRCILEFSGTGDITLVLFNSAQNTVLESETVTIDSGLQEVKLNWRLDNTDAIHLGEYYFGYFTSGVTVLPYKRDYNNANVETNFTHLFIEGIQVPTAVGPNLFNLDDCDGAEESWGLNPDITVFNDYTDLILNNEFLFATAIQLQGQINLLTEYMASIRSNQNERFSKRIINQIIVEIEGANFDDTVKTKGIKSELGQEIQRIRLEIEKLKDGYFINDRPFVITRT